MQIKTHEPYKVTAVIRETSYREGYLASGTISAPETFIVCRKS